MKSKIEFEMSISPKQLAETLAASTPEEFSDFWYEFSKITEKKFDFMPFADRKVAAQEWELPHRRLGEF